MEKVLTSKALWEDFNPQSEPLETNVLRTEEKGGITTKTVYFTGRTVEDGKTRVFAKICYQNGAANKKAVLLIDSYKKPIDEAELKCWATNGFIAMAIDFCGRTTKGVCTLYPLSLDYCNADVAQGYYYIGSSAKQTKIYEYALNCMRAITYLLEEEHAEKISVVTVKKGCAVGMLVLGTDTRITNGAVIFGSLYREYVASEKQSGAINELDNESLAERLAIEEKRQMWEAGIAPQGYAMQIQVPVYVVVAANSVHVSSLNSNKMYYRLNDHSRIFMLPLSIDYMSDEQFQSVINFCNGRMPSENTELAQITTEEGDNFLQVVSIQPQERLEVWYSRAPENRTRNWVKAELKKSDCGYVAELDAYAPQCQIIAYVVVRGAVNISTAFCELDIKHPSTVKIPNRSIFTGNGIGNMIPYVNNGSFHGAEGQVEYCKGYLDIVGAKGKSLATFALNDPCLARNETFAISFDICCDAPQMLNVYAVTDLRTEEAYCQTVQLAGDGKWQRVTLEGVDFKKIDGRLMQDNKNVKLLLFKADSEFIINNVFII